MAIRIDRNTAPRLGRITMPQGTYLSQPTTAAVGGLGGGMGMNPAWKGGMRPGGATAPVVPMNFLDVVRAILAVPQPGTVPPPSQIPYVPQNTGTGQPTVNAYRQGMRPGGAMSPADSNSFLNTVRAVLGAQRQEETRFATQGVPYNQISTFTPKNDLVGTDIGSSPAALTQAIAGNLFPGQSPAFIAQQMTLRGYSLVYQEGQGGVWVKTASANPALNANTPIETRAGQSTGQPAAAPVDAQGRPEWLDPTVLQPGERVTTQSGATFVGGTPTASGQAQYAVTYPGGADDERFKWAERTTQDNDGNWVKVYSRELRKVYSRSHRRKQQARAEEIYQEQQTQQQASVPSITVQPPVVTQGLVRLVNFRADFG